MKVRSQAGALLVIVAMCLVACAEGGGGSVTPVVDANGNEDGSGLRNEGGGPPQGDDDDDVAPQEDASEPMPDRRPPRDTSSPDDDDDEDATPEEDAEPTEDATTSPECERNADCADGNECNGIERCVRGACVAGTPIDCDDDLACTDDSCSDGMCLHEPDDGLCDVGETCDRDDGCVPGCAESPCRLTSPQCGCAEGQACYLGTADSRLCATAGTLGEGATCSATTSCTAGMTCLNIASTGRNAMCMRFCDNDRDCTGPGSACALMLSTGSGTGSIPGVALCTRSCNPATNDGCPSGAACSVFSNDGEFVTDCNAPAGTGGQGASCETDADCQASYGCIDADGAAGMDPAMCLRWCRVGTSCTTGTCTGFSPPLLIGGAEYGACS